MTDTQTPKTWAEYKEQLLEGLNEKQAKMIGCLMENAHKENIKVNDGVNAIYNEGIVNETAAADTVGTSAISRYDIMFQPLVRRTMPALLAMDLVGVQPLTASRGIVRTLRNVYGEDTETTAGSGVNAVNAGDEASGENVYQKYSLLQFGGDYDEADGLNPFDQTLYLESNRGKPMKLEVVTDSVDTKGRKLSATYSLEAADDLNAYDGLDIESELTQSVGDEILRDLDRELIDELTALAGTVEAFDFAVADGRYAGERLAALAIAIDNLSAQIAIKTRKAGATWMVVSQRVFTGLKHASNGSFVPATNNGQPALSTSLFVGTFGGNVRVYVDPYAETDTVLMGYKGSEIDTGFKYCPYIPLSSSGVIRDPATGDHRLMLRTRYGLYASTDTTKGLGDAADYYARATVANLNLGFTS